MAQAGMETKGRTAPAEELMALWGYLLNRTALHYKEMADAAVAALGLSGRLTGILRVVQAQGPLSQQRLGGLVGVDRSTMVLLLDALEAKALVERQSVAGDRRSHAVAITAKGRRVLEQALEKVAEEERGFMAPLSASEQKALKSLLGRLILAHHPQEEGA
jgi:DNA-binding MarR family transcriptional regulator